ncbi:MAG: extracellular solute-binding protein, partial [Erysipelotrichaceae bacterium]|nr:extracellular solute-binding protein [Erysipelotrichaceae bacterium]
EGQEALLNTLAEEFMEANKNVTVEVINTGSAKEFEAKVTDSVNNGVGPNLIFNFGSFATNFDGYGKLLPFNKYWDFDYASLTSAGIYAEATNFSDGNVNIAPVYTAGPVLFVNKAIFDKAGVEIPTTWDEMKTAAKTIYEKTGVVGLSIDSLTDFAQLLIFQSHQGKIVDMDKKEVIWNDAETEKWLNWWAEGVQAGYFQVQAQAADGYNSSDFNSGLIASYIGSTAGIPYLDVTGINGELAAVRVPMISDAEYENAGMIWNRSAIGFKSENEAENQATADFVKYFIDNNKRWVMELNANSPYTAVQEDAEYQTFVKGDIALSALGDQLPTSFVAPVFKGCTTMREELKAMMQSPASDSFNAKTAIENAANRTNAAMKE